MYQYEGRAANLERRNQAITDTFNTFPRRCETTGAAYNLNSIIEKIAWDYFLSPQQVERIVMGRSTPKKKPKPAQTCQV